MNDDVRAAVAAMDWSAHNGSLPKEGAVYPKGQERLEVVARVRHAFSKVKLRQTA